MGNNLVIVESPAKAKTIEKFLGNDYQVKSSYGHIRDLAKKNLGIDIENDFTPHYEIDPNKKKVISELKKLAKDADTVWLASDEDREGEAIAWHLYEVLKLKDNKTKRIVFHEITNNAINRAIENPRQIDFNLVNAQQARRILDRLVGFEISPVLWKKVKPSLSAGRVQSVAVRLLVEREREIINFKPKSWFKTSGVFRKVGSNDKNEEFKAELNKKFRNEKDTKNFLELCKEAEFTVGNVSKKPGKKSPAPPFTTSTLQQEAGRKLNFSVSQTMSAAQRLYEAGLITYMRTDSVNLSQDAIKAAKAEIVKRHGSKYSYPRNFETKNKSAQEAHEAIRPSYINKEKINASYQDQQLYQLIWQRTIASQMSPAELEKTTVDINISDSKQKFIAQGEIIKFDGFLKVYMESSDDDDESDKTLSKILPPLKKGDKLNPQQIQAQQKFSTHPPRYNEATLVKKLEELGIGRPSTYAPTISTIQQRGYVEKETREGKERKYRLLTLKDEKISANTKTETYGREKSKLFPTNIGIVVNDFLLEHFAEIFDYNFTAKVEEQFDDIAKGEKQWNKMLDEFYKSFHPKVEKTLENSGKNKGHRYLGQDPDSGKPVYVRIGRYGPMVQLGDREDEEKPKFAGLEKGQLLETITLEEALKLLKTSNEGRYLGEDPATGKPVRARIGRYGPFVQLGRKDDEEKPRYASLLKGQSTDTVTLEEALELFKFPRNLGEFENTEITCAVGRFGPYVKHDDVFVSLKKQDDPLTITQERAIELIKEKREKDRKRIIKTFNDTKIKVVKDRWGKPCVQKGRKFYRVSTKVTPTELSLEDCKNIIEEKDNTQNTTNNSKSTNSKSTKSKSTKSKSTKSKSTKSKSTNSKSANSKSTKSSKNNKKSK